MALSTYPVDSRSSLSTADCYFPDVNLESSFQGRHPSVWGAALFLIDFFLASASIGATYMLIKVLGGSSNVPNPLWFLVWMAPAMVALWLVQGYEIKTDFLSLRFTVETLISQFVAIIIGNGIAFVTLFYGWGSNPSRLWIFGWIILFAPLAIFYRRLVARPFMKSKRDVVILGCDEDQLKVEQAKKRIGDQGKVTLIPDYTDISTGLLQALDNTEASIEAVVLGPSLSQAKVVQLPDLMAAHLRRIPVLTWDAYFGKHFKLVPVDSLSPVWLFSDDFRLAEHSVYAGVKRLSDILLSLILLLILSPVLIIGMIGIWLSDPGSVMFHQERIGWRGRKFTVWKLRTMKVAPVDQGTTKDGDSRVFPFAKWLRRYRVDEIPQLWNILRGDMSLIGPRPEWTRCVVEYEKVIPFYHLRHAVKPGLTGWAQVNYPYGENSADAAEKLSYDLYYISRFSMVLDCSILIKTVFVMAFGHGGR